MWQRFTERARRVIFFAQEEAVRLGENSVSTEHLLLGLIREDDTVAARILDQMGVNLSRIRTEIERQLIPGTPQPNADPRLTPRAQRVIDLTYDEARELGNNYIGTEHLLLGLIREGEGLAGRVLHKLELTLDSARDEIRALQHSEFQQEDLPAAAPLPPRSSFSQAITAVQAYTFGVDSGDWELAVSHFANTADVDYSALGGPKTTFKRAELQAQLQQWLGKPERRIHTTLEQSFHDIRNPPWYIFYYTARYFREPAGQAEQCTAFGWYRCQLHRDQIVTMIVAVSAVEGDAALLRS